MSKHHAMHGAEQNLQICCKFSVIILSDN